LTLESEISAVLLQSISGHVTGCSPNIGPQYQSV